MKGKRTGVLLIVLGGVLAAVAGFLVYTLTSQAEKPTVASENFVVAAQDIPERTIIPANAVTVKKMPVDAVPVGAVKKADDVVGRMSLSKIQVGEVVLGSKLADTKGQSGVSFTLERGKVVVTFPATNIIGLGLVLPGDAVDLLVTYKPASTKAPTQAQAVAEIVLPNITQTTMQNLKVLTIGPANQPAGQQQQQQTNQGQPSFITFAVDPQDALFLKSIKDAENLVVEIALRAAADSEIHKTEPVSFQDVLSRYGIKTPADQASSRR